MTFSKKKLPKSQIELEVKLSPEEVGNHRQKAVEALARELRIEGFRLGHVPSAIAEKHLGNEVIFEEAARFAVREAYIGIVGQENLDVIGEPEIQITKLAYGNPLEFRVQVALLPAVELADYKKIAGQSSRKKVAITEEEVEKTLEWLRASRKAPELTNEFAQGLGNFKDVESLRSSVKEGMQHEKEGQEKERLRQEIIEKITDQSKLDVPEVLLEREKNVLLAQIKQGVAQTLQIPFEEYLRNAKKTEKELFDSFAQEAEQRVKRFLVLRQIASQEKIGPEQEEVEREMNTILQHYESAQHGKQKLDSARLKEYTEGVLRHEKTLQFLEQFAKT